jgi:hypothetical protein
MQRDRNNKKRRSGGHGATVRSEATRVDGRQMLTLGDFDEADIAALEEARAPETSRAFDGELTR